MAAYLPPKLAVSIKIVFAVFRCRRVTTVQEGNVSSTSSVPSVGGMTPSARAMRPATVSTAPRQ